jgi:hypothetical protein
MDAGYETVEEAEAGGQIEPLLVRVDKTDETAMTPEFGSWQTISWAAAQSAQATMQQLLPESRERTEANIYVWAGAGAAATAFVRIGTMAQVLNNAGGQIPAGVRFTYHASQPVFVASDGVNAMNITFLDERYLR